MELNVLKKTVSKEDGIFREELITNHPTIRKITYVYEGTEESLDKFLKCLIMDELKKRQLID